MRRKASIVIGAAALILAACAAGTRVIVFIDLASFLAPTDAASLQAPLPSIPTSFDVYFLPGYEIVLPSDEGPSEALRAGYPVEFPVPDQAGTGARVGLRIAGSISVTPAPLTNTTLSIETAIAPADAVDVYDAGDGHVVNIASSESDEAFTVEFDVVWETGTDSIVDEILGSGEFRLGVVMRVQVEELPEFESLDPTTIEVRYDIEYLFIEITAYPIDFLP